MARRLKKNAYASRAFLENEDRQVTLNLRLMTASLLAHFSIGRSWKRPNWRWMKIRESFMNSTVISKDFLPSLGLRHGNCSCWSCLSSFRFL